MSLIAYKITCRENGKSYIGITTRKLDRRWYEHKYVENSCGQLLAKAIKKYGEDAFDIEQIASCFGGANDLKQLEKDLIQQFGTKVPNGYNLTDGGDGVFGLKHSNGAKAKMSLAKKGKPSALIGYKHTDEARKNMSKAHIGLPGNTKGKPSPLKGVARPEAVRNKISETKRRNRLLKLELLKGI